MKKIKAWIRKQILIFRHRYTSYCVVCEKDHKNDGRTENYCTYCKKKHKHYNWRFTGKETICGEYWRPRLTMAQKVANMSPQEVLSGVHLGMDEQKGLFREETMRDDWGKMHAQEVKDLYEAL